MSPARPQPPDRAANGDSAPRKAEQPVIAYCERHPRTETELRCNRCDTLICPQCLVYTPVGVRCADCAMLRRPPMYELGVRDYAAAAGVALAIGVVLGVAGGLILPPVPRAGLLSLAVGLLAGIGAGSLMVRALTRATNRKRGTPMQVIAAGGLVLALVLRVLVSGEADLWNRDTAGALMLVVAVVTAWGRLR